MNPIALEDLSEAELDALIKQIEEEKLGRRAEALRALRAEVFQLLDSRGFTLEELLSGAAKVQPLKKGVRYRHPIQPELVWVCHGKRPAWVSDALTRGLALIPVEG